MKKVIGLLLSFVIVFSLFGQVREASAYTGGLLNGLGMSLGKDRFESHNISLAVTDNNESVGRSLYPFSETSTGTDTLWKSFETPKTISSFKYYVNSDINVKFYDTNDTMIYSSVQSTINTGTLVNITPTSNVSKVVIENAKVLGMTVYEFDVFEEIVDVSPEVPSNLSATGGDNQVLLSWSEVAIADTYNVQRSTIQGGPYITIESGVTGNNYTDTSVTNGTTYYYVVTAVNTGGESGSSNEATATPVATETTRALLTLYLTGGQVKEYDLSSVELDSFLTWFDNRAENIGPAKYAFNKTWNKGPFKTRKEYVIFSKIDTFDVDEYEVTVEE